jgi:hypothetical protein
MLIPDGVYPIGASFSMPAQQTVKPIIWPKWIKALTML